MKKRRLHNGGCKKSFYTEKETAKEIKDSTIKDVRKIFRLKKEATKEIKENIVKNVRNPFRLKKEKKTIKERIIRDIRNLFELQKDYYEPVGAGNFYSNDHIEYESNADRN